MCDEIIFIEESSTGYIKDMNIIIYLIQSFTSAVLNTIRTSKDFPVVCVTVRGKMTIIPEQKGKERY